MAGVSVETKSGARKSLDSEINMIPMIDLLMVTVSFLLITAVWSQMGRLDASAQVPAPPDPTRPVDPPRMERRLHVEVRADGQPFVLTWREGQTVIDSAEVRARPERVGDGVDVTWRYPDLTDRLTQAWRTGGAHRDPTDPARDVVVLHTANELPYAEVVRVMDAIYSVRKHDAGGRDVPAYAVSFAVK